MPSVVDLLTILSTLWVWMFVVLCMSKKRFFERNYFTRFTHKANEAVINDDTTAAATFSAEAKTAIEKNDDLVQPSGSNQTPETIPPSNQQQQQQQQQQPDNRPTSNFASPPKTQQPSTQTNPPTTAPAQPPTIPQTQAPRKEDSATNNKIEPNAEQANIKQQDKNNVKSVESDKQPALFQKLNIFAAAARKFKLAVYPLKGIERDKSVKKSIKAKKPKSPLNKKPDAGNVSAAVNEPDKPTEPKFLSEKSCKNDERNDDEPQFESVKKAAPKKKPTEELFKSCKVSKKPQHKGGESATGGGKGGEEEDDEDYDEGDDTLQGVKSLKQDLSIPSTVE
ncbi:unnamed protein product [Anisakis simplex]|uniref:Uncharacterized protein n=1 Tax=Anisakis simplex TaxID=6269 RepID=A0A0M3JVC6_ANISI|nr:unnamed protein product [Anisakis simplex]